MTGIDPLTENEHENNKVMTAATNTSARLRGAAALTSMVEFNELHVRGASFAFAGERRDATSVSFVSV